MLDVMLGNDEKGFSSGEVYAFFRSPAKQGKARCSCSQEYQCKFWSRLRRFPQTRYHSEILKTHDFVVDSSKQVQWIRDINNWYRKKSNIEVVNLVIWKNPVNTYHSFWKRQKPERFFLAYQRYFSDRQCPRS